MMSSQNNSAPAFYYRPGGKLLSNGYAGGRNLISCIHTDFKCYLSPIEILNFLYVPVENVSLNSYCDFLLSLGQEVMINLPNGD